jgi:hypothetical protein
MVVSPDHRLWGKTSLGNIEVAVTGRSSTVRHGRLLPGNLIPPSGCGCDRDVLSIVRRRTWKFSDPVIG